LYHPILSINGRGLLETAFLAVFVTELAACKLNDLEREMVSYSMNVVRELLRVGVCLVLRLSLHGC
jgi:hypothetical protein